MLALVPVAPPDGYGYGCSGPESGDWDEDEGEGEVEGESQGEGGARAELSYLLRNFSSLLLDARCADVLLASDDGPACVTTGWC